MCVLLCTCVCVCAHTWMHAHAHKAVEVSGQFCGVDTFLNLCMDSEDWIQVSRYNHLYILSHVAWMSMNLVLRGTKINKESVRVEESRASETKDSWMYPECWSQSSSIFYFLPLEHRWVPETTNLNTLFTVLEIQ